MKIERDKEIFVIYYFVALIRKKLLLKHQFISFESAPLIKSEYWSQFKSDDFDLKECSHSSQPKMFKVPNYIGIVEKFNSVQTLEELAKALNIDKSTISNRLHAIGKIQKEGDST